MWYNINIYKRFRVFDIAPNTVFFGEDLTQMKLFRNPQFFYSYKKLDASSDQWDSSLTLVVVGDSWKVTSHASVKSSSVITVFCYEGD